ncbi:MAG: DnaB-like helicase N-terminal domain-containing protein, partial [Clostridia bacterium]
MKFQHKEEEMAEKVKKISRGMPNNAEAEASVLGSALIDNNAANTVIPMLKSDDFYIAANRDIFEVMRALQEASKPVDTVSVADALEVDGKLSSIGISYLSELAEGVPSAANCEYYAKIIKRDSLIRKVIEAGNDIAKKGYECADGAEALDNAERLVYQIAEQKSDTVLTQAGSAFAE